MNHHRRVNSVRDSTDITRTAALNRELAERLIVSQEVERKRIAFELHDDVSQRIAMLQIEIDQVAAQLSGVPRRRLREVSTRMREIAHDVQALSSELYPSKVQLLGLVGAISSLCREMSDRAGVHIAFMHRRIPASMKPEPSLALYRIVQEALHNVIRHSEAADAEVSVTRDQGHTVLTIADSGIGFDPRGGRATGLGLVSMQARVTALKGQFTIDASPGKGTRIVVRVPHAAVTSDAAQPAQ